MERPHAALIHPSDDRYRDPEFDVYMTIRTPPEETPIVDEPQDPLFSTTGAVGQPRPSMPRQDVQMTMRYVGHVNPPMHSDRESPPFQRGTGPLARLQEAGNANKAGREGPGPGPVYKAGAITKSCT